MNTIIILIKLIAAHLVGDFIFQTDSMCKAKLSNNSTIRYSTLALHAVIQAALSYLFIAQWNLWLVPLVIGLSHFVIDYVKTLSGQKDLVVFVIDQMAHYLVIIYLWWFVTNKTQHSLFMSDNLISLQVWMVATAYISVLTPTSLLIKSFVEYEKWLPTDASSLGLPNAGKWIGYIERILILTFIFTSNIEGIGFLLAAKSVFRFGELNQAKDIKITEYVLIGTLSSFALAILIGFSVQLILGMDLSGQ